MQLSKLNAVAGSGPLDSGNEKTRTCRRALSDQEASYYLTARQDGVNDMYLHLGISAPAGVMDINRVRVAWAILRARHPLLAARVEMGNYDDINFVFEVPRDKEDALQKAQSSIQVHKHTKTKDELIDAYLNGPRMLSGDKTSTLVISEPLPSSSGSESVPTAREGTPPSEYDVMICATHFIGDAFALHCTHNDLYRLLGGGTGGNVSTVGELEALLQAEIEALRSKNVSPFPLPMEARLRNPTEHHEFRDASHAVEFATYMKRQIGGHAFPRKPNATAKLRHTVIDRRQYSVAETTRLLKRCKSNGVSIGNVITSLANLTWAKLSPTTPELPAMFYSAANMRPYLPPPQTDQSYFVLSISYYNVTLPSFIPTSTNPDALANKMWYRARNTKAQSVAWSKNKMLIPRAMCMAIERGVRARKWAKIDDEADAAEVAARTVGVTIGPKPHQATAAAAVDNQAPAPSLSVALAGLSLPGNLDPIYDGALYPAIELRTHQGGIRQRSGATLLIASTLRGILHVKLHWDKGTLENEPVRGWWQGIVDGLDALLDG